MTSSLFDVFKVGIGPSSSHTVGPMLAARAFAQQLAADGLLTDVTRLRVELFGSLGATGWGHGTGSAVLLGLEGEQPALVDAASVPERVRTIRTTCQLRLLAADRSEPRGSDARGSDARSADARSAEPRSAEPRSAEPHSAEPRSAEPRSAEPHSAGAHSAEPRSAEPRSAEPRSADAHSSEPHNSGAHTINFDPDQELIRHQRERLPFHPNAMSFTVWAGERKLAHDVWYSIGGGVVIRDDGSGNPPIPTDDRAWPYPFRRGAQLVDLCHEHRLTIPELMWANELSQRPADDVRAGIDEIWRVMTECIHDGCDHHGTLPGGLFITRRAPQIFVRLQAAQGQLHGADDPLAVLDWVTLWALAVNEENAAGGRIVTAPTNGAAGVIPAVATYAATFLPQAGPDAVRDFLLTAAAIGSIFVATGSISGAEVGCQGEVGAACAMAAAGLAQLMGGTPQQVVNAAEIGLEHHLGMTCDPVGGLVQVPCIERNAVAAIKAITAARLAVNDDGYQYVTLDNCIRTMMETGLDMHDKYKETSRGGLAVNIVEC